MCRRYRNGGRSRHRRAVRVLHCMDANTCTPGGFRGLKYPTVTHNPRYSRKVQPSPSGAANAASDQGYESSGGATLQPGTIVYNPSVQKYFIMEDSCLECGDEWKCKLSSHDTDDPKPPANCVAGQNLHIDFWMPRSTPAIDVTLWWTTPLLVLTTPCPTGPRCSYSTHLNQS